MTTVGGWTIFAHPLMLDEIERLTAAVERARADHPEGDGRTADAKPLAPVRRLLFAVIPQAPSRSEQRQDDTLGAARKHCCRAEFGNGRLRSIFRYDSRTGILIVAWANVAETLHAYRIFKRVLDTDHPSDDWAALLEAASAKAPRARLRNATPK